MKTAFKVLAAAALLALLAWTGTFLYWHFRILGAIRTLETQLVPTLGSRTADPNQAAVLLMNSGCRCLPYLVKALEPSKNPEFLNVATYTICWMSVYPGEPFMESSNEILDARLKDWVIANDAGSAERLRKIDAVRAWWREGASEQHQWWRVWSGSCRQNR